MAGHLDPDPIDQEVARTLADNPGLLDELREFDRRFAAGEVSDSEFVSTDEVRRQLGLEPLVLHRADGDRMNPTPRPPRAAGHDAP